MHVKKEKRNKKEKKMNTTKVVKNEWEKRTVEKRAQDVLGRYDGHVEVKKRAQEVLGQLTATRWVEKEKEKEKRKKNVRKNNAVLLWLLLWCLPCSCSAQGTLVATNTSPAGSRPMGAISAVPWNGSSLAVLAADLDDSNCSCITTCAILFELL